MNLHLCPVRLNRNESSISGTVKRQESLNIGCSSKYTLSRTIKSIYCIRIPISLFLPAQKALCFLNTLRACRCDHFRHFNHPMTTKLTINFFRIQFADVIGEPVILYCHESKKCRFSYALTTDQTEHIFKLNSRAERTGNSSQQKHFHTFIGQLIHRCTKKMMQHIADTFLPIPLQTVQIIPDRVIFVPICLMDNTFLHNLIHRQTVSLFQIKHNIVQIHICECRAYPFPPHGFYNVCLLSQNIVPEYIF